MDEHATGATEQDDAPHTESSAVRQAEQDEILAVVDAARGTGGVLVIIGAPGAGKTTLVTRAAGRFGASGGRVLRAAGVPSEADLAFSALHQLLRPVREGIDGLPPRQRDALRTAFGLGERNEAPDPMLIGMGVLTLLSDLAADHPVLLVMDDAQWTDGASLDALSFAARRLADEPVTMVLATHDGVLPELVPWQQAIDLPPLDRDAARLLLAGLPEETDPATRERILDQGEGNPLALVELTRAAAERPYPLSDADGPLPVTDRLELVYAKRLAALPDATRRAIVRLATADADDPPQPLLSWLPGSGDPVWAPAEKAGLVRRSGGRLVAAHALVRLAVHQAAPADERRTAHLELAGLYRERDPDRYAWHLAAATTGPSARVATELENSADRARRRSGYSAATHLLERAAQLHPVQAERARLLVTAARTAVLTGKLSTVERLAARTRADTDDPTAAALAAVQVGRLMAMTTSHSAAFGQLIRPARMLLDTAPAAAVEAVAAASVVGFYSSDPSQLREIEGLLTHADASVASASTQPDGLTLPDQGTLLADWARTVARPEAAEPGLPSRLPTLVKAVSDQPDLLTLLAIAAWLIDETDLAAGTFDTAFASWASKGPVPNGLSGTAALAYLDQGRWARAQTACAELAAVASAAGLDHAAACSAATDAMVRALRGDLAGARDQARYALELVDPAESRGIMVLAHRALGTAATAEGDHETAYQHYRALFDGHGHPTHYHLSYPALPQLASAAARCGRNDEATLAVDAAERSLKSAGNLAPRRAVLVQLSRAILSTPDEAEPYFTRALTDPVLGRRPMERAQALLAHGEWLRRRRRIAEARPSLAEAEATFRRLGARPWTARAQAELRAAGAQTSTTEPNAFTALTPQQQQIVRLAATGLTNREVAEKLFLSPRTVGSHLYRAFPKLGITARSQLRDVVDAIEADIAAG
ncbi:helix-turn-helix transcriptional regulator [Actinacidiphila sp. bgisy145]|uniref:helix-turn-helix transcriptional regulator n=1 Tax=Actinacidiphila sp. bgisy145 TaxID=3413792 RepID=UPI003EB6B5CB